MEALLRQTECTCSQELTHIKWHSIACQYRLDWLAHYKSYYMSDKSLYMASNILSLKPEVSLRGDYTDLLDREYMRRADERYNAVELEEYTQDTEESTLVQVANTVSKVSDKVFKHSTSYVYMVFVDGCLKYIGKGKGDRYKHTVSGASSVAELNRDLFTGKSLEVKFVSKGLTDQIATLTERDLIGSAQGNYDLYNKLVPVDYLSVDVEEAISNCFF